MNSGRQRLVEAATRLLASAPAHEPTTRELCDAAGVAAPTLYHHFGTKEGLVDVAAEHAFDAYLAMKREMPRTGHLLVDFASGWDLHIRFGVENPVLYARMYGTEPSSASRVADAELRRGLQRLADAGLLLIDVDEALALTTATAIGCVTQLNRSGGSPDAPLASAMRDGLVARITGGTGEAPGVAEAAHTLLAQPASWEPCFTTAEAELLRQWLRTLSDRAAAMAPLE